MNKNNEDINLKKQINEKEVDIMPTIELIEQERLSYLADMKKYLENLKNLPREEAYETSKKNLLDSGIIDEDGNLSERYKYSRDNKG
ncbi:MAG: hypothetical protein WCD89_21690 [Anaerocolumna sp.]